jgi:predicted transcriptional regulator
MLPDLTELGELQLAVLQILWERSPLSVHEVVEAFAVERRPAYTTVLTVLRNLEKRGLVTHEQARGSRMFRYRPAISQDEACTGLLMGQAHRLFRGSVGQMVLHLLRNAELSACELDAIDQAVAARRDARKL